MKLRYLAIGAVALWAVFGSPTDDVAGLFWTDRPATWEQVDAVYYPDRHRLSIHRMARGVGSLDACRSWVRAVADAQGDPGLSRGDYECGIGKVREMGDETIYRITAR